MQKTYLDGLVLEGRGSGETHVVGESRQDWLVRLADDRWKGKGKGEREELVETNKFNVNEEERIFWSKRRPLYLEKGRRKVVSGSWCRRKARLALRGGFGPATTHVLTLFFQKPTKETIRPDLYCFTSANQKTTSRIIFRVPNKKLDSLLLIFQEALAP